ncbi:MAG: YggS family pyridoxal phosphate-dependent enzyme [Succinivibrionaceae bacterium]|nr:YggS family pyridoxal phosphate-dependent enzyme [Succinivibrionaceae bacterium]
MISENISQLRARIAGCCRACGRDPAGVTLLCVSKTKPCEMILEAYAAAERHFGESYAKEAALKIDTLRAQGLGAGITWHFIGPLQANKTRPVAERFDLVESVDRLRVAQRLSDQRPEGMAPLGVLIEVNIGGEAQKSGCPAGEAQGLADAVAALPRLELRGFMGIARDTPDQEEIRREFMLLRGIYEAARERHPGVSCLSMGMTHDLEIAIACGATEVRVGTAIFGARGKPLA